MALKVFSLALLLLSGVATVRGQSALDGFDPNANAPVQVVVVQPDGKLIIVGNFTTLAPNGGATVTRNHIARLNPDGSLDAAFNPNANGTPYAVALQPDGKILVGGIFTSIGGQTRTNLARLDAITGLADAFNPNANGEVDAFVVLADGKILVGGVFTGIGGQLRNAIARLDGNTGLADTFNPNATGSVYAIVLQADGRLLVAGDFTNIGGQPRNNLARLDATTGLADSFNPNANAIVFALALQADGKILAAGNFSGANSIGGQTRNRIARLDATTGLADAFDPNANDNVYTLAVQPDGKILAGGNFSTLSPNGGGAVSRTALARLKPDGTVDPVFSPNANTTVLFVTVQSDGKILAGGGFTSLAPSGGAAVTRNCLARLETDGRLDRTFNPLASDTFGGVYASAVQPDGKILIGGDFDTIFGVTRNGIARLNTDGTLDTAFNPNAGVGLIAVQADGKILVAGPFQNIGGQARRFIARLDGTTGLADSFNPNPSESTIIPNSLAIQADGKILVGGPFTTIGGQSRNGIARLDAITGLADSFNPNPNGGVNSIAVQADGRILVGGNFTSIGGQTRNGIARLNATTGLADSFNPNPNGGRIGAMTVQGDGKILVSGGFTSIGGQTRTNFARLDATTGLADSFNPNVYGGEIFGLAVQSDGKVLANGLFTNIGGQPRYHLARLDATTGLADSFDPNPNEFIVWGIALQADGKILAAGDYSSIGGQPRKSVGRLNNDTAALQNLAVTQTNITWTRGGSSPQFTRVTFEASTNYVNYTSLGNGSASGSNWTLTGLNLATGQNLYLRARGYYGSSSSQVGSQSIQESVRNVFLATPPPQLTIIRSGANVVLRWPTNALGFALQSTTNLVSPTVWSTVSPAPVVVNGQNTVTDPVSGPQRFYRLSQ